MKLIQRGPSVYLNLYLLGKDGSPGHLLAFLEVTRAFFYLKKQLHFFEKDYKIATLISALVTLRTNA